MCVCCQVELEVEAEGSMVAWEFNLTLGKVGGGMGIKGNEWGKGLVGE